MFIGRFLIALILAAAVTLGLLLTMHYLISSNLEEPKDEDVLKIPDVTMDDRNVDENVDVSKVEKPEDVEEPPPELPEPVVQDIEVDNTIAITPTLEVVVDAGNASFEGEYLPISKAAARYPARALSRGLEGYCTVAYTVTTIGTTANIVEADCPQKVFLRASIAAAKKFKYKPKVVDGEPIEVPNVTNRFIFELSKES